MAAPPSNNADAPLNVSSQAQSKIGGLLLNTGGAGNALIIPSGNVGIGTISPEYALDVHGKGSKRAQVRILSEGNTPNELIFGVNDGNRWALFTQSSNDNYNFGIWNYAASRSALTINTSNYVGVGGVLPQAPLHILSNLLGMGEDEYTGLLIESKRSVAANIVLKTDTVGTIWEIGSAQWVGSGTGFYKKENRFFIEKDTGNVGIGTAELAGFKLNVKGSAYVDGVLNADELVARKINTSGLIIEFSGSVAQGPPRAALLALEGGDLTLVGGDLKVESNKWGACYYKDAPIDSFTSCADGEYVAGIGERSEGGPPVPPPSGGNPNPSFLKRQIKCCEL